RARAWYATPPHNLAYASPCRNAYRATRPRCVPSTVAAFSHQPRRSQCTEQQLQSIARWSQRVPGAKSQPCPRSSKTQQTYSSLAATPQSGASEAPSNAHESRSLPPTISAHSHTQTYARSMLAPHAPPSEHTYANTRPADQCANLSPSAQREGRNKRRWRSSSA